MSLESKLQAVMSDESIKVLDGVVDNINERLARKHRTAILYAVIKVSRKKRSGSSKMIAAALELSYSFKGFLERDLDIKEITVSIDSGKLVGEAKFICGDGKEYLCKARRRSTKVSTGEVYVDFRDFVKNAVAS